MIYPQDKTIKILLIGILVLNIILLGLVTNKKDSEWQEIKPYLLIKIYNQDQDKEIIIPLNEAIQAMVNNQKFIFDKVNSLELNCPEITWPQEN